MILKYKNLKDEYIGLFNDQEKCDFVLTDVLFAFNEIYKIIDDSKTNTILEIGSGTSILLNELSKCFPNKNFLDWILTKGVIVDMKRFLKKYLIQKIFL